MKFVVVVFSALLIVLREGSAGSTDLNPKKVIFLHLFDGTWTALDEKNGRLLWSYGIENGALITASHSNKFYLNKNGDKTLLIPSLQSDLVFEYNPGSNELHPKSIQELELGETREKVENRELLVTGIGLYSGRRLYHCNAFDSCREENEKEPVIDVTSVKRTVCSVEKDDIEQIDWCYQVSEIVSLRILNTTWSKEKLDFQLSFEDHNESVYVRKKSFSQEESQTSWNVKISSPVASAWSLRNGNLVKIEMPTSTDPQLHLLMIRNYNGLTYVHAGSSTVKVFEDSPNGVFKTFSVHKGSISIDSSKFDSIFFSSKTNAYLFGQYKAAKFSMLGLIIISFTILCVLCAVIYLESKGKKTSSMLCLKSAILLAFFKEILTSNLPFTKVLIDFFFLYSFFSMKDSYFKMMKQAF